MNRGNLADRPALANLGDDLGDLVDDLLVVRLILKMSHTRPAWRVISHCADKQDNGAGVRRRHSRDDVGRIHRIGGHGNEI